jgi:hypothetical protein
MVNTYNINILAWFCSPLGPVRVGTGVTRLGLQVTGRAQAQMPALWYHVHVNNAYSTRNGSWVDAGSWVDVQPGTTAKMTESNPENNPQG